MLVNDEDVHRKILLLIALALVAAMLIASLVRAESDGVDSGATIYGQGELKGWVVTYEGEVLCSRVEVTEWYLVCLTD